MLQRTIIMSLISLGLISFSHTSPHVQSATLPGIGDAPGAAHFELSKESGHSVARAFKAPFKALGRLFGGGSKNRIKLERMTEKDARNFESAALVRINDSRSPSASVPSAAKATALEHFARGRELFLNEQLNEAIAEFSQAVALDPGFSQAHSLLGVAYQRKGLSKNAKKAHARALEADRANAQALNNSGYSLFLNGDYRGAVEHLKRAAKLAPTDGKILNNLGMAQFRLGQHSNAFKNFVRAGGEFYGWQNTALLFEDAGLVAQAIKGYEAARYLRPDSPVVLGRLVELYQRTGRRAESEVARQALKNAESQAATGRHYGQ